MKRSSVTFRCSEILPVEDRALRTAPRRAGARLVLLAVVALGQGPPGDAVTAVQPDSLRFAITVPADVRLGRPVPVTLRLTNVADRPVELHLLGRDVAFDIIVAAPGGQIVWRRLEGASVQQILQVRTLAPGETFELKDVWNQRSNAGAAAAPGDYTLTGVIPTDGAPLRTARARLRITP